MEVQNNSAFSNPSIYSTHAPSSSSWSQISLALQGGQRAEHPLTHSLHGLTAMPSGIGEREIEEGGAPSVREQPLGGGTLTSPLDPFPFLSRSLGQRKCGRRLRSTSIDVHGLLPI